MVGIFILFLFKSDDFQALFCIFLKPKNNKSDKKVEQTQTKGK